MSTLIFVKLCFQIIWATIISSMITYGAFADEEKIPRLIDLSPKETQSSLSGGMNSQSGIKSSETSQKNIDRRAKLEKIAREDKGQTGTTVEGEKDEKENIQSLINSYILETYKSQGEKILKDLDLNLQKKIPDIEKRIKAYDSIQTTLELRKNRILKVDLSDSNKDLLSEYFDYMIDALEKRKELLNANLSE